MYAPFYSHAEIINVEVIRFTSTGSQTHTEVAASASTRLEMSLI